MKGKTKIWAAALGVALALVCAGVFFAARDGAETVAKSVLKNLYSVSEADAAGFAAKDALDYYKEKAPQGVTGRGYEVFLLNRVTMPLINSGGGFKVEKVDLKKQYSETETRRFYRFTLTMGKSTATGEIALEETADGWKVCGITPKEFR